jgi:hypothetical protein
VQWFDLARSRSDFIQSLAEGFRMTADFVCHFERSEKSLSLESPGHQRTLTADSADRFPGNIVYNDAIEF